MFSKRTGSCRLILSAKGFFACTDFLQRTSEGGEADDNHGIFFFLFLYKNIYVTVPRRAASNEYPQHMFYGELGKIIPELSPRANPYLLA